MFFQSRLFSLSALVLVILLLQPASSQAQTPASPQSFETTYLQVWQQIENSYVGNLPHNWAAYEHKYDGKLHNQDELRTAISEMLAAVGDKNLLLLSQEQYESWQARLQNGIIGIGLQATPKTALSAHCIIIDEVQEASTAEDAGLKTGWTITRINDHSIQGMLFSDAVSLISGSPDTSVKLTVLEGAVYKDIIVKRDLDGKIGVSLRARNPSSLFVVEGVVENSPAALAGVKINDIIAAVNNLNATGKSTDWLLTQLRNGRLGSKIELTLLRNKTEYVSVNPIRSVIPNMAGGWSAYGQPYGGINNSGVGRVAPGNFDSERTFTLTEADLKYLSQYPSSILDLRGSSGYDAEIAARTAALFLSDGEVLRQKEKNGTVLYRIDNKCLYRIGSDGSASKIYAPQQQLLSNKLVVLVDDHTSGAAEALASALQRNKRATVVGSGTAGNENLCRVAVFKNDNELEIAVKIPVAVLEAKTVSLSPNRRHWWFSDSLSTAEAEAAGIYWYNDFSFLFLSGFVVVSLSLIVFMLRRLARVQVDNNPGGTPAEIEEEEEEEETQTEGGDRLFAGIALAAVSIFVIAIFAGIMFTKSLSGPSTKGMHGDVVVELYTDGSVDSQVQADLVKQLEKEYAGPISFSLIDVKQNPHYTNWDGRSTIRPTVVESVPSIRIIYRFRNDKNELISGGTQGLNGKVPKRDLVMLINIAKENLAQTDKATANSIIRTPR
jgi:C-terminal processing protease CtpA/Prc